MNPFTRWFGAAIITGMLLVSLGCGRGNSAGDGSSTMTAKETVDETVKQTFQSSPKPTIVVDTFAGAIAFEPAEGNSVQVDVLKQGWGETKEEAAENLKKIDLVMKQEGDTIRVTATKPENPPNTTIVRQNGHVTTTLQLLNPGKTDVRIKAPAQAILDFKTKYGDIAATGAANQLKANSGSGAITVKKNEAAFNLTSQYGAITVDGPGAGQAKTSSGNIDVHGCQQPIVLDSGYGTIVVSHAAGVAANTSSGDITISASKGPTQLKSGYGRIGIKDANGSTKAESSSGDVHIAGAEGDYVAKSGYGTIKVEVKDSPVQAESSSGNIDLRGCRGAVKAQSGYGTVDVHGDNAVVQLRSNSGNVHFVGSLAEGESHVSSGYGESVVKLPADSQFKVQAHTGYGNIRTQFDVKKTKENERELVGSVGADPKTVLHIETQSGNVRIDKEK